MTTRSDITTYAAQVSSITNAVVKFFTAELKGSSTMFSEAIYSTVDPINQWLLLLGI